MKNLRLTILFLLLTVTLFSCGKTAFVSVPTEQIATKVDREGSEIEMPKKVDKIISLAPSTTQILIDLGLEDKIIATDAYSVDLFTDYGDRTSFDIMSPDVELLASLEADIIFATSMSKASGDDPLKLLKTTGTIVTYIPTSNSIEDIEKDILFISEITNEREAGLSIVSDMYDKIEYYRKIGSTITDKKTVYFEIAPSPKIYTFGSGVFLNEIIEIIGAENIFKDQESWITVSPEAIIERNPDVIFTNVDYIDDPISDIINRPGFSNTTAVKNGDVYKIDNKISSYSNHNIVKAMEEMAVLIYPSEYK